MLSTGVQGTPTSHLTLPPAKPPYVLACGVRGRRTGLDCPSVMVRLAHYIGSLFRIRYARGAVLLGFNGFEAKDCVLSDCVVARTVSSRSDCSDSQNGIPCVRGAESGALDRVLIRNDG